MTSSIPLFGGAYDLAGVTRDPKKGDTLDPRILTRPTEVTDLSSGPENMWKRLLGNPYTGEIRWADKWDYDPMTRVMRRFVPNVSGAVFIDQGFGTTPEYTTAGGIGSILGATSARTDYISYTTDAASDTWTGFRSAPARELNHLTWRHEPMLAFKFKTTSIDGDRWWLAASKEPLNGKHVPNGLGGYSAPGNSDQGTYDLAGSAGPVNFPGGGTAGTNDYWQAINAHVDGTILGTANPKTVYTDEYIVANTTNASTTDGDDWKSLREPTRVAGFRFDSDEGPSLYGVTWDGSTPAELDLGVAIKADNDYIAWFQMDQPNGEVRFYLYDWSDNIYHGLVGTMAHAPPLNQLYGIETLVESLDGEDSGLLVSEIVLHHD